MKIAELRAMTDEELKRRYVENRKDLFRLQVRFTTEQVENPRQRRAYRREMARIKTLLRERELKLPESVHVQGS